MLVSLDGECYSNLLEKFLYQGARLNLRPVHFINSKLFLQVIVGICSQYFMIFIVQDIISICETT